MEGSHVVGHREVKIEFCVDRDSEVRVSRAYQLACVESVAWESTRDSVQTPAYEALITTHHQEVQG